MKSFTADCGCPILIGYGVSHGPSCTILAAGETRVRCPGCSLQVKTRDGRIVEHDRATLSKPSHVRCEGTGVTV